MGKRLIDSPYQLDLTGFLPSRVDPEKSTQEPNHVGLVQMSFLVGGFNPI